MSSYDQLLHRLNLIPPQADKLLRGIRRLDQEVEQHKIALENGRQAFLDKLQLHADHKTAKIRQELDQDFQNLARLQATIETKSREKITTAEKLYSLIHEPTERLEKELHIRGVDKGDQDSRRKRGKKGSSSKKSAKRGEWEYDPNEPKYCYCSRPSFGEMVMCDNTFCEREWFHLECIEEKKLPEHWFCRHCRDDHGHRDKKARKK